MKPKPITASQMGKIGGKNRALSLSPERRKEISLMGVEARRIRKEIKEEAERNIKSISLLVNSKEK